MPRYLLTLQFDGSEFCGWQYQPEVPTVQHELEQALALLCHEKVNVCGAGRTDTGVHARRMYAHFDTTSAFPVEKFPLALNGNLPEGIRVLAAAPAADRFHARFDATRREYRYFFWNSRVAGPFLTRYAWRQERPLDPAPMRAAAALWLGTHDFDALCGDDPEERNTVRTILATEISARGGLLCFAIAAPAFLRSQVRRMAGLLAGVGRGDWPPGTALDVLTPGSQSPARSAKLTAPAHALFLWSVDYPGFSDGLPDDTPLFPA